MQVERPLKYTDMAAPYLFNLHKMKTFITNDLVHYQFKVDNSPIEVNALLGNQISLRFTGIIHCVDCGKITKKSFGQGFCYTCFMASPLNSPCILHPELCEAHIGKGRNPQWEEEHHNRPHFVYLANSGGIKVGVTREDQIPTRWIDQGADSAVIFARTPHRRMAGEIEVFMKNFISDKTNWRKMLQNIPDTTVDLIEQKEQIAEQLPPAAQEYYIEDNSTMHLHYPFLHNLTKISSVGLEKKNEINGKVIGIKGQYILFDTNEVINIRNHQGFQVALTVHA